MSINQIDEMAKIVEQYCEAMYVASEKLKEYKARPEYRQTREGLTFYETEFQCAIAAYHAADRMYAVLERG